MLKVTREWDHGERDYEDTLRTTEEGEPLRFRTLADGRVSWSNGWADLPRVPYFRTIYYGPGTYNAGAYVLARQVQG